MGKVQNHLEVHVLIRQNIYTYTNNNGTLLSPSADIQWKLLSQGAVVQWPLLSEPVGRGQQWPLNDCTEGQQFPLNVGTR